MNRTLIFVVFILFVATGYLYYVRIFGTSAKLLGTVNGDSTLEKIGADCLMLTVTPTDEGVPVSVLVNTSRNEVVSVSGFAGDSVIGDLRVVPGDEKKTFAVKFTSNSSEAHKIFLSLR